MIFLYIFFFFGGAGAYWKELNWFSIISDFRSPISAICSACFYHIRDLRHIRCYLDLDVTKFLANALVSSRLDYCNSILSGITDTDLVKLQRVQNRLPRTVTKSPPFFFTVFHCYDPFIGCQ